nr:hypothetical protein [uncultured Oribacterium sp.]
MELLDHLAWRNDVPLSIAPFNEVDNVILAYLSYIDFAALRQEWDGFYDLKELFQCFCEKYSMEEIKTSGQFTERALLLLQKMMEGARFFGRTLERRELCDVCGCLLRGRAQGSYCTSL